MTTRRAALKFSAACALCALLAIGMLWPVPLSFAAAEAAAEGAGKAALAGETPDAVDGSLAAQPPADDANNVTVEAPSAAPAPDEPAAPPAEEPVAPSHDNAWPIGADRAVSVVAELWDDGTFVVDGSGDTLAFESAEQVPWLAAGVAFDIKRVIFADAVEPSSVAFWFEGCANLEEVANVPAASKDLTHAFYECPKLVELPDDFALSAEAEVEGLLGFDETPVEPLVTVYRGTDEYVLAYDWARDGRALVNPDAPAVEPDPEDELVAEGGAPADDAQPPADDAAASGDVQKPEDADVVDAAGAKEAPEPEAEPGAVADAAADTPQKPPADPAPAVEDAQVNITVPSSVSMMLSPQDDPNSAIIPVMVANRSERTVAITGARLKRADMDLPGGSWSLTTEGGETAFVQDARFTPLGVEVSFDRPVILAAGDPGTRLAWRGAFTDYGMKQLLDAVVGADGANFTYGSMIWIVSAV